jgi:hypothetical protein
MGAGKNRIGDSQLTIEFLGRYKPREIERGEFAEQAAVSRDQGTPASDVIAGVRSTSQEPIPGVTMAVQGEVEARLTELVKAIYARPERTPAQEKQAAYEACLETPVPQGQR